MITEQGKKIRTKLIFSAILIAVGIFLPFLLGLGRTGFDLNIVLQQFFLYSIIGTVCLIGIWVLDFADEQYKGADNKYGESLAFFNPGDSPAIKSTLIDSNLKTFLLFGIIFGLFSIYAVYSGTAFSGIGAVGQQFTAFDNIVYNATLVVISENLGAAFALALVIFSVRSYARKNNLNKISYLIFTYLFGILAYTLYGIIIHLLRYGSSDVALVNVLAFWAIGGIITLLTGSFVPFAIAHSLNNIVLGLKPLFATQTIYVYLLTIIIGLGLFYAWLFIKKRRK